MFIAGVMSNLSRSESRRMYSWWWDSHNTPKNSKGLQDNLTEISGPLRVESDNNCENVGVFGALELDVSAFAAKLTDESEFESRLAEPSFSLGTSVGLQKKPMRNPVTVDTLDEFSSPDVLEDRIYVIPCMYHIPRSCGAPSELKSYAQS